MGAAEEMFPYATHQELLISAVMHSVGPVLEMGCGHFSTSILHHICLAQHRPLASADSSKEWLDKFRYLESGLHNIYYIPEDKWDMWEVLDLIQWGVVFVDHAPAENRVNVLKRLHEKKTGRPEFVVLHDSNADHVYHTDAMLAQFKYMRHDTRHAVHTAVMSDTTPVDGLIL